jgi:DNA primase
MSLPKVFMDELRARVPLSELIGKRMKLTRMGREHKGCCPFHKEKSASFTVNDIKGFYHCFGCGAHGDAIAFLTNHDNMAFMDAIEHLASLAGMQVPKATLEDEKKYKAQAGLYDLMEVAAKYYEAQLYDARNKKVLRYLTDRGLTLETIKAFRIGLSPQDGQGLKEILLKQNFKKDMLVASALFKNSTKVQDDIYAFFRGRVMFPVQDFQGRVVAFGARVLPQNYGGTEDKSAPKYINSAESDIFHKGRLLYGLSRARKAIGDGEPVVVVEGYMDVIALTQAGFRAAVAPLGTALTETQVQELWKVMPEDKRTPILCFDGDAAGQRAAGRSLERILPILKPDHSVRFAFLPPEHDPDSLIKAEGVTAMDKILKSAIGLFDMMWREEAQGRDLTQPESKAGFKAALEKTTRLIADMTVQQFFIHEIGQRVNDVFLSKKQYSNKSTKAPVMEKQFFKGRPLPAGANTPYRPVSVKTTQVKSTQSRQNERIRILIALMINHPALYDEFGEDFGMIKIDNTEYAQIRQSLIILLDEQNNLDYQTVKQHLIQSGHDKILDAIFDNSLYLHAGFAKPDETYETVRQAWCDIWEIGFMNVKTI